MKSELRKWVEPLNDPFIIFLLGVVVGACLTMLIVYETGGSFCEPVNNADNFNLPENIGI